MKMNTIVRSLLGFLTLLFAFQSSAQTNVLFIGNSYTYYNSMPTLLIQVGLSAGDTIYTESHTPGGAQIQQHAANPTVYSKIKSRKWDYVVIQCQSQEPSFPDGQVASGVLPHAKTLCDSIRANDSCTIPLFYMTWGRKNGDASNCANWSYVCTYEGMDSILFSNYQKMGDLNQAEVSPVGAVWHRLRDNTNLELYHTDGSHPSYAGSLAAAYTFYSAIFRKSPNNANFNGSVSASDADSIRSAVQHVLFNHLDSFNIGLNNPDASFTMSGIADAVVFTPKSGYDSYHWDFGDSTTSTEQNPTHSFEVGEYTIYLTVTKCGISAVDSMMFQVTSWELPICTVLQEDLFPNPSTGEFRLPDYFSFVRAYNMLGQDLVVKQKGNELFQISGTPGQVVFIQMKDRRGAMQTQKLYLE